MGSPAMVKTSSTQEAVLDLKKWLDLMEQATGRDFARFFWWSACIVMLLMAGIVVWQAARDVWNGGNVFSDLDPTKCFEVVAIQNKQRLLDSCTGEIRDIP